MASQRDLSAGEVDVSAKRDDANPVTKAGLRQMSNWRILATNGAANRPGRAALFEANGRVDKVLMSPGNLFHLCFGAGTLKVRDNKGIQVFTQGGFAWASATARSITWAVYDRSIYITFPGQVPKILTWDGTIGSGWSVADFAELVVGNQKRTLFYRIAPKGITLSVSALTGTINITFSSDVLVAGMVGTRIRYNGRQMTIATVVNSLTGTATVNEPLASSNKTITFLPASLTPAAGDIISNTSTGATATIVSVAAPNFVVLMTSAVAFNIGDFFFLNGGPIGQITNIVDTTPGPSVVWDQEVMNSYQGWPQSLFVDQNRLGFCDFPSVPAGIAWSALGVLNDFYPDAFAADGLATDAIFELAPNKARVLYVAAGAESNEFVFCDNAIYYIPITQSSPLKPGSVSFNFVTADGAAKVQPRLIDEVMIYVGAGATSIMALTATGSYTRFYRAMAISSLHSHLFNAPYAIAAPTAGGAFPERYIYVLNQDGTIAVGNYSPELKDLKAGAVGWVPWSGAGTVGWISALAAEVVFTTAYAPNGIGVESIAELLDNSRYLDASQKYETQPEGLPIPGGKGPLWWIAGGTVDLMDGPLGTRMMGTYTVDANGFLVPQNNGGEDFTSVNLVVGQAWSATLEPFIPAVQAGQDVAQRMWPRRVTWFQAYVANSTGFVFQRLYSGRSGAHLPALGTVMAQRRVATWNQGEDATQPPPLREQSYLFRPSGRAHDPRIVLVKDTPGPLSVLELSCEVTT